MGDKIIIGGRKVTESKPRGNTEDGTYHGFPAEISGSASPGEVWRWDSTWKYSK